MLKVTQIRSAIATKPKHRGTPARARSAWHWPVQRATRPSRDSRDDCSGTALDQSRRGLEMKLHDLKSPTAPLSARRSSVVVSVVAVARRPVVVPKDRRLVARFPRASKVDSSRCSSAFRSSRALLIPSAWNTTPVNLDALGTLGLTDITHDVLVERGLCRKKDLVKVLGRGTVPGALNVSAHRFSASAKEGH